MSQTRSADFRSDTVTRPTPAMLAAMQAASVGDDVFGDDPTVNLLEQTLARLLGFEAALFTPSGTMANQIALALHTRPGDSVIAERDAHIYALEVGAAAALSGVQFDLIPWEEGFSDEAIARAFRADHPYAASTTMLVVENTHNMAGGRVLDQRAMNRIAAKGKALGLKTHCDGARIWNAAAVLGVAESELLKGFDTAAVCFSKGLGAPMGSALCGDRAAITRARKIRKRFGGGLRQVGYVAAGVLHALEHHRTRLSADHALAAALAKELAALARAGKGLEVRYPDPGTNMVFFRLARGEAEAHVRGLVAQGVLMAATGGGWIRAVCHLDVGQNEVARAVEAVGALVGKQ